MVSAEYAWKTLHNDTGSFAAATACPPQPQHGQRHSPVAAVFSCSELAGRAEALFDQPAGAIFTVSTFGLALGYEVSTSIDYAVMELGVPLVVVLGHRDCRALTAVATDLERGGRGLRAGYVRGDLTQIRSCLGGSRRGVRDHHDDDAQHVAATGTALLERSALLAQQVRSGQCAIACTIGEDNGAVQLVDVLGQIGELPTHLMQVC